MALQPMAQARLCRYSHAMSRRAVPQRSESTQHPQECLLRQVLRHVGIPGHAQQGAVDLGAMLQDDLS